MTSSSAKNTKKSSTRKTSGSQLAGSKRTHDTTKGASRNHQRNNPNVRQGRGNPRSATGVTLVDLAILTISGLLMWAAFPDIGWWFLTVPSLILLICIIDRVGPARAGVYAAFWAMVFMMPLISWMQVATDGTTIAWIALAGAQAFFIGLWGVSFSAMGVWPWARTIVGQTLGGALLWVTFEELRSRIPYGGFSWGRIAWPQVDSPLVAFAPLGGEVLVAFVVFSIAVLVRRAVAIAPPAGRTSVGPRLISLAVVVTVVVIASFYRLPNAQQSGSVEVALIQGNVEVPMQETFSTPRKVTGNHVRQTREMLAAGNTPDVIFWGENATDIDPRTDGETFSLVEQVVSDSGVPLVFGLMEYSDDLRYNWVGVWDPNQGLIEDFYGKQHPVPWGEYIPMRELTTKLATAAAQISVDMVSVDNPGFMEIALADGRTLPIAIGICFEVAYEPIIAEGVQMGGELIVIPTNNAHFQNTAESVQQLQMGQFRAAQFSRSTLQVSTNGVSAIIRPDGTIYEMTQTQTADYLVASVPLRTTITPSAAMGESLAQISMVMGVPLAAFSLGAHLYGRSLRRAFSKETRSK